MFLLFHFNVPLLLLIDKMKKYILIFIAIAVLQSCKKLNEYTQFNMPYTEVVTIPSSSGVNLPFNVFTPETETNSESTFEVNDTRKDLIETIKVKQIELNVQSPAGEDFSFLESISLYLSATDLPEVKIAWNDSVAVNTTDTLKLNVYDIDLQEYIKKEKFELRLNTVTDEFLTSDYKIEIKTLFFVDAQLRKK